MPAMLLMDLSPPVRAYAAVAIRAYCREMHRNGQAPPAQLAELAEALMPARDGVTGRDPQPDPAARARQLSAARSARYRARKRQSAAARA
jgi:hypothetical protein